MIRVIVIRRRIPTLSDSLRVLAADPGTGGVPRRLNERGCELWTGIEGLPGHFQRERICITSP